MRGRGSCDSRHCWSSRPRAPSPSPVAAPRAPAQSDAGSDTLTLGAAVSLTGKLAREGGLTKEGYEICQTKVNAAGGVPVGGKKLKLDIQYQDDTSKPDTAAQLVEQFNDKGVKLILELLRLGEQPRRRPPSSSATAR